MRGERHEEPFDRLRVNGSVLRVSGDDMALAGHAVDSGLRRNDGRGAGMTDEVETLTHQGKGALGC